jgi:hypothetical protein
MDDQLRFVFASALALAGGGCGSNPPPLEETGLGPVDDSSFPVEYRGAGVHVGAPSETGGLISASAAWAHGHAISYYRFSFPGSDLNVDDLLPPSNGPDAALGYVFDPAPPSPYPAMPACVPSPDVPHEGFSRSLQSPIFTRLPSAPDYLPVVAEVPVTSHGEPCQALKSESGLLANDQNAIYFDLASGGSPQRGRSDGRYLAWAIIDPYARLADPTGSFDSPAAQAARRVGFWERRTLLYVDGGYLPTNAVTDGSGGPGSLYLTAQTLYYPDTLPPAQQGGAARPGMPGMGHDVLQFARGDAGYSPLCHVLPFTPLDPTNLPTDATGIDASRVGADLGQYVFCLVQ